MKEIGKIITAIQSRDGEALAKIANRKPVILSEAQIREAPQEVKAVVNELFTRLAAIFHTFAVKLEDPQQAAAVKRQWLLAFMEAGIRDQRQIEAGLHMARQSPNPFAPSPGEFIAWCREGFAQLVGLPTVEQIQEVFRLYCRDKGVVGIQGFRWPEPIYFHIVPRVYDEMRHQTLDAAGVTKLIKAQLNEWALKLARGEEVPPIPVMIADKSTTPESARIKRDPAELCDLSTEGGRRLHAMFMRVRAKRAAQEKK